MRRRTSLVLTGLGVVTVACALAPSLLSRRTATGPAPGLIELATLPPPLAEVEFPTEPIEYPAGWPEDLRYPEEFDLVDASSGSLPGSSALGWGAKLRYEGDLEAAASALSSFYEDNGWEVAEQSFLDTGGVVMVITREAGSGILVMDADGDDPAYTNVVAVVFPEQE